MQFLPLDFSDIQAWLELDKKAFSERSVPSLHAPPFFTYQEAYEAIQSGGVYGIYADASTWCGVVWLQKKQDTCYIQVLELSPEAQGKGLGTKTMLWIFEQAHAWGCADVALTVEPYNIAAQKLYTKHGFSVESYMLAFFGPNHPRSHRLLMRCVLACRTV